MTETNPVPDISTLEKPKTSKFKAFFVNRKRMFTNIGLATMAAAVFLLGRKSKDVVKKVNVDVDVERPDDNES